MISGALETTRNRLFIPIILAHGTVAPSFPVESERMLDGLETIFDVNGRCPLLDTALYEYNLASIFGDFDLAILPLQAKSNSNQLPLEMKGYPRSCEAL